jgi:23S rRNA (uracil1939-C5)-methyltransferase
MPREALREALAAFGREAAVAVALDGRPVTGDAVAGDPVLALEVRAPTGASARLRASPASFYQVNLEANALLVEYVVEATRGRDATRALDLYAGIGNLGIPLALCGVPVVAVEAPGPGARDLAANARAAAEAGARVEAVAERVERFDPSRVPFDAVILDPPRAGAPGVLERVVRNRPRVVVYVSCFAPNAARDIGRILDRRYALAELRAFDLFPDTHHVEVVAVLERR